MCRICKTAPAHDPLPISGHDADDLALTDPAPELTFRTAVLGGRDGCLGADPRQRRPLDENSMYCNLVQCEHFSETCVIAELDGVIVGWISAFIPPDAPDTCSSGRSPSANRRAAAASPRRCSPSLFDRRSAPMSPPQDHDHRRQRGELGAVQQLCGLQHGCRAQPRAALQARHPFRRASRHRVHGHDRGYLAAIARRQTQATAAG